MTKTPVRRRKPVQPVTISRQEARAIWIDAQRLNRQVPFGRGPDAVRQAIEHLGYVQIDTINVIERCHHHILYNRIPHYRRTDLATAQSDERTVFEYWTHALSYVPVRDIAYFTGAMKKHRRDPVGWGGNVPRPQIRKMLNRIRDEGALTISDIKDDRLVDKSHPWASRKPSKRALQAGFYTGELVIARRDGMLKTYELTERHFGWDKLPRPATERQVLDYRLDRALRATGVVCLDSVCHLAARDKPAIARLIDQRVRAKKLVPVRIEGADDQLHWAAPESLEQIPDIDPSQVHILSPFDPLIIQRKRTERFFGYFHLFEAYVPREKRQMGYFTLPVLAGDEIVAALDLKADRQAGELLIQAWHWIGNGNEKDHKPLIDEALEDFARFQLTTD